MGVEEEVLTYSNNRILEGISQEFRYNGSHFLQNIPKHGSIFQKCTGFSKQTPKYCEELFLCTSKIPKNGLFFSSKWPLKVS